jgi:hypothetical protein
MSAAGRITAGQRRAIERVTTAAERAAVQVNTLIALMERIDSEIAQGRGSRTEVEARYDAERTPLTYAVSDAQEALDTAFAELRTMMARGPSDIRPSGGKRRKSRSRKTRRSTRA